MKPPTLRALPFLLLLAGCGESPGTAPAPAPAPAPPAAPAKPTEPERVDLAFRLEKGKTYRVRAEMVQDIVQSMGGQEQEVHQTMEMGYGYHVEDVDADGDMRVRVSFDTFRMSMVGPMGTQEFDSADPPEDAPPAFRPLLNLTKQSLSVTLTPRGTVKEIRGVGEMLDGMMAPLEGEEDLPPAARDQIRDQMRSQFGDEALRKMFSQMTAFLPGKPVAAGDSWDWTFSMMAPFPLESESTYEVLEIRKDAVVLGAKGTFRPGEGDSVMEMGPMRMRVALEGTIEGRVEMDRATGWILRGEMDQEMKGTMTLLGGGGGEDMEIPMSVKGRMKFSPVE